MSPAETAVTLANNIPGGDPIIDAAKWVFFILVLIGAGTYPFMLLLNKRNKDRNENQLDTAISSAGSSLYTQLIKQVDEYRKIADDAYKGREALLQRVSALELQVALHKSEADTVARLTYRLTEKDAEIAELLRQGQVERARFLDVLAEKEKAINTRDDRISQLEHSVSALQERLVRDEARQIFGAHTCPFAKARVEGKKLPESVEKALARDCCGPLTEVGDPPTDGPA